MNQQEFLAELRNALSGLPQDDIEERLAFYTEMIDDRMEEGMTEQEAVAGIGSIGDIVSQTISEVPLTKIVKTNIKQKRSLRAWEIVLIVLGFPLWFSLLAAVAAVALALYIVVWALVLCLWAIEVSLWACAICGIAAAVLYAVKGFGLQALAMLGMAIFCAGISIFLFYGCVAATKGAFCLTKKAALAVKSLLIRKETAK